MTDLAFETFLRRLTAAGPGKDAGKDPGKGGRPDHSNPAEPPEPGPEQAPHEHPDDPGIHPDGPKRYHDDHATPARQCAGQGVTA